MAHHTILLTDNSRVWVDADISERLGHYVWYATPDGTATRVIKGDKRRLLHREIMNSPQRMRVGFLDGNKRNCQRINLFLFEPNRQAATRDRILLERGLSQAVAATPDLRFIPLLDGGEVMVDAAEYDRWKGREWRSFNGCAYTILPPQRQIFLHREIMGNPKGLYIGFLDGNKLNCCKANMYAFVPGAKEEGKQRALQILDQAKKKKRLKKLYDGDNTD